MTRIPTQKRSIEKREKIIEKGFELICKNGYYNTNTKEIAKYAGVSTGIIYQYFKDKKEIFKEGINNYADNIMFPMIDILKDIKSDNIEETINNIIDSIIKSHTMSKKAHEELMAMAHLDHEIANTFKERELMLTKNIVKYLDENNIKIKNSKEKIHIIIGIVDNFSHEVVYHNHKEIDYDVMKDEVIKIILNILK